MADQVEMQDIRGLDIDKTVKGFALRSYTFKSAVTVSNTPSDHVRWYQETAAELTATSPMNVSNKATMAVPTTLEEDWTRNTSYIREFMAEGTISEMDMMSSDIDVMARTLLRLTRAVVKQVDAHIFDIITESQSVTNINSVTTTSVGGDQWDAASGQDPIKDILRATRLIEQNDYETSGLELWVSPQDKESLLQWLISTKGASIPQFASEKVRNGVLMEFLGLMVRVSNNVTADYAVVLNPSMACTYRQHTNTTSVVIKEPGLHNKIRVWERGLATLTDPKAVTLIIDTQT